jgi:hypothetical protein
MTVTAITEFWSDVARRIQQSPRQLPSAVTIPRDHVDQNQNDNLDTPFRRNEHYFQVRVNEMFLAAERKWFSAIDPTVFIVSEFTYNKEERVVPYLIGPGLMKKHGQDAPKGMIFRNTRVAGTHPYRGGRLSLSIVLCQVTVGNYARQLLGVLESAANALNFATSLGAYLKIANVVMDGFQALLGSDASGAATPLAGLRTEFDPDAGDSCLPGFYALIDRPDVDPQSLWVRDNQLMQGSSLDKAEPYREADFVLYSVVRPTDNARKDLDILPFYELWERVMQEAAVPKEANYESAKANMLSLYQTMLLSPDLTSKQAEDLADEYANNMARIYKRAVDFANRGETSAEPRNELDDVRSKALKILRL